MVAALQGIKVLDLSRVGIAGMATMILSDFGAEVIKVETPSEDGKLPVGSGVSPIGKESKGKAAFRALNRNKKSIALNLKSEKARQVFIKMVKDADVFIEGFRPGVTKRLGIDYETISKINPSIIYCSISGYGQDGPYKELSGHDPNYISIAGALGLIGESGGPPVLPLNFVADWAGGGLHAAIGILLALMARGRTKKGQFVDISMTDGAMTLMTNFAAEYFENGVIPRRGELMLNGAFPCLGVYKTRDNKYVSLGSLEPHFWENTCKALNCEQFIPFQWDEGEKRKEIFKYFRARFLEQNRDEWIIYLRKFDLCSAPVYELNEALNDPQLLHRKMIVEVDQGGKKVKQVGIAIKLSDTPGEIRFTAPYLGEHTDEILKSLGYSPKQIEEMRKDRAIQ